MPISRLLPAVVAVAVVSLSQYANAATPLPQFYDANFQACLSEQAARNGWTSAEQVTVLSCPNRKIEVLGGVQQLMNLTELDLSNNSVRGTSELGELRRLAKLNLAGNTSIMTNDLGYTLPRLSELRVLNLNGIRIGSFSNLGGLKNQMTGQPLPLMELELAGTDLQDWSGAKSLDFLRPFTTLKKLNVADNGIQNVFGITDISELEELDLSNNSLPSVGVLNRLTKLKRLNLSGNTQLTLQEIEYLISANPDLTSIKLNGIAIGNIRNLGPLIDRRTGQPLNLTELDLGNTGVLDSNGDTTLEYLRPFVNLRKLNLANNGIRDTYPLSQMQQLKELDLSGNQLTHLGGLGQLRELTRLNLSGNRGLRFDEVKNMLLMTNPQLSHIGLNGIRIGQDTQWLSAISYNPMQASGLLELDLGNTSLDMSALMMLGAFANLQRLNLAGNQFGMAADYYSLIGLRQLQDLDLSGNAFRSTHVLSELTGLRRLNLSQTAVRSFELPAIIDRNPNLRSLGVNSIALNHISDLGQLINRQTGRPLDLLELDLGNTGLKDGMSLGVLEQFTNLQRLNLSGNGIEDLSVYMRLPLLRELDLSHNRLRVFHPGSFVNLVRLNLSGNVALDVRSLNGQFANMPALRSLGLGSIAIGNINNLGPLGDYRYGGVPSLLELDLSNTGLTDSNGNATLSFLQPFVNLRALNVANNGISDVMALSNLTKLQTLDLSGNQVTVVGFLSQLRNLTSLNLSGNHAVRMEEVAMMVANNPMLNRIGINGIRNGQASQWLSNLSFGQAEGMLELDLGNTRFDSTLIPHLTRFQNLQRLNLANQGLSAETDMTFLRTFGKLTDLDLSGNALRDFYFLSEMSQLRRLNLSNTALRKEDVRIVLDGLPNLTSIGLNGVPVGHFSNLGELRSRTTMEPYNLTELDLGNTGLEGSWGKRGFEFLRQFSNLQRLNLAGNGIEDLQEYAQLSKLIDLDISNNRLQMVFSSYNGSLQNLNLGGNSQLPLSSISQMIANNPDLRGLGLNGIAIGNISNLGMLSDARTGQPLNLVALDLGNTGVLNSDGSKRLDFLTPFTNLQRLNLAGNGVTELGIMGRFTKLRELDLSNNAVQYVLPLTLLRSLTHLNLSGNPILNINDLRTVLDQSGSLVSLGLNGVVLNDISALGNLQNPMTYQPYDLVELDLGNTRLSANGNTGTGWVARFQSLQRLNLAGNALVDVRGMEMLNRLNELDLSNNGLMDVTPLTPLPLLKRLNLSGNPGVPGMQVGNILRTNSAITHLGLNGINLGSLANANYFAGRFGALPLVELDIGNTGMSDINGLDFLQAFPGITRLNVSGNNLQSFNGVRSLPLLDHLDVSNNGMTVLWDVAVARLKTLNLTGNNQIPCVDLDQFVSMMNTTVVTRPASCGTLNQPPTASAGADQTLNYVSNVTLTGSGVDSDGTIASYAWVQTAGPQVFLTPADAATTSFAVPELTAPTVFSFQLTVVDDKGASATSTTNVTVKPPVNEPPVASAGANQTAQEGASVVLEGSATDSDGTIVSYDWIQTAGPAVVLSTPKTASSGFVAPAVTADTVLTFQLTVQDNKGASASNTTNVLVTPKANALPVADAGTAQTVVGGATVTLTGSGTDSDGSIVSYDWVQTAGPAVTLSAPKAASTTFVAPLVSVTTVFTFQMTVVDNRGGSALASVSITVNPKPNAAPVANAGASQTLLENRNVTLAGSGSDSDGSIVSYKWVQTSGPLVTLATPNAATTTLKTPLVSKNTVLGFRLTVTDNSGATASSDTSVTVLNAADFSVTALSSNLTSSPRGSLIVVSTTSRNSSNIAAGVATATGFYLTKTSGSVKTTDVFLGSTVLNADLVGYTAPTSINLYIPGNLTPGVYYLGAIADYEGKVDESNESNNTRTGTKITVY